MALAGVFRGQLEDLSRHFPDVPDWSGRVFGLFPGLVIHAQAGVDFFVLELKYMTLIGTEDMGEMVVDPRDTL